ncbi:MAG: carbonic anhydrase [Deltaproteobacteria bacterium]|nr:carbonic anhydrase [Deltaproteobacteria bacterium]
MIERNVLTDFSSTVSEPSVDPTAFVHALASIIGNVTIERHVFVAPMASVRGDEGQPIFVGADSNIQDGVVIHALETELMGKPVMKNLLEVDGKNYAVYVGSRVSLAHQAQIHGPATVRDDTFIGMKSLVFRSSVGARCVVEPGVILMGVAIPDRRYIPAGSVLTKQEEADNLPLITDDYPLASLNRGVVHVNTELALKYAETNR